MHRPERGHMTVTALAHAVTGNHIRPRPRLTLVGRPASRTRAVRIAIAGGSTLVRAAFRALLETSGDFAVAGESDSGDAAVELSRRIRPDVVLICIDGSDAAEMDSIRRIAADTEAPAVQVMVLSTDDGADQAFAALRAGAHGFLPLDTEPAELVRAVRIVARGEAFLSPRATRSLITELTAQPGQSIPQPEQLDELTAREREVMALAAAGLTNHEIAARLTVSLATAKTHVSRAMMKVCAHDRAQLVALAYKTGLVLPRKSFTGDSATRLAIV
jgi:DNA-binding NarL/FixJ family response regulator